MKKMNEFEKKTVNVVKGDRCDVLVLRDAPKVNQVILSLDNEIDELKNHLREVTQKITGTESDGEYIDRISTSIRTLSEFANADSYYHERFDEIHQLLSYIDEILFK